MLKTSATLQIILTICFFSFISIIAGCGTTKALKGSERDFSPLKIGASRTTIIKEFGEPETSVINKNGLRTETYIINKGKKASTGRALGHAGMTVLTLGWWELSGAGHLSEKGKSVLYIITYDQDEKVMTLHASPII